jgi:hypothetical protein
MSDSPSIPPPPLVPVVVPETTEAKLTAWKKHIHRISPRIRLVDPSHKDFDHCYTASQHKIRQILDGNPDYTLVGFPAKENIFFFVAVNTSLDSVGRFNTDMFWVFSAGNIAFAFSYFEWDGDAEDEDWAETYSLRGYSSTALSWEYVLSCIVSRIEEIENKIPNFPIKFRRRRKKKKKKMR